MQAEFRFFRPAVYKILFCLLGVIYLVGLFVPLMDNDSAHHANIALHMYLTGDYLSLVDYGKDYLDKPHLHFWLCAFSYKIFGVSTFAYKLPSLLFTVLGVYSTFRLGKRLYNTETGRLAALILASSFAFILANNDVRMDAILTACIAFATWQLIAFADERKILNAAGAALGLALGFATKGHIAVFVPGIALLFYLLYRKDWKFFLDWRWILIVILFAVFISPVVYAYYQQFNLHPEKEVRGQTNIDGVKFILLNQSVERFSGGMGSDGGNDYFFFLHSFLWAFAPWSILAYIAVFTRLKEFASRKEEWMTTGVFITMLVIISLSGFKLPHYLNICFPLTSIMTAAFILRKNNSPRWMRTIFMIQMIIVVLLLIGSAVINGWAFPVNNIWVIVGVIIFLAVIFYFLKHPSFTVMQKAVGASVAAMIFSFYLLNSNFYPQLLQYQGGNELAFATRNKVNASNVYFWNDMYSSSYNFYTRTLRAPFDSTTHITGETWLLFDIKSEQQILESGISLGKRFEVPDYEITKLDLRFVNPERRESQLTKMVLAEIKK